MQETRYTELEERASRSTIADEIKNLEARTRVRDEIAAMRAEGKALVLTEEEENMLWSFRRFKVRMRRHGEVFKWQTRRPEGIQLVEDTAEVILPQESSR